MGLLVACSFEPLTRACTHAHGHACVFVCVGCRILCMCGMCACVWFVQGVCGTWCGMSGCGVGVAKGVCVVYGMYGCSMCVYRMCVCGMCV